MLVLQDQALVKDLTLAKAVVPIPLAGYEGYFDMSVDKDIWAVCLSIP